MQIRWGQTEAPATYGAGGRDLAREQAGLPAVSVGGVRHSWSGWGEGRQSQHHSSPTAFSFLPGLHSGELGPEHTPALATSTPVSWGPMPTMAVTQPAPSPAPSRSGRNNQSCLLCRAGLPAAS